MARFNSIQLGTIHYTHNGLMGGKPCKTEVKGLEPLKPAFRKTIIKSITGKPHNQFFEGKEGIDIEITFEWMTKVLFDQTVTDLDTIDSNDDPIDLVINGDTGGFPLKVVPAENTYGFGKFSNGILQDVVLRFVTIEVPV